MELEYIDDYTGYITSPTLAHRYVNFGSGGMVHLNTSFCIDTIKLPKDVTFIPDSFCSGTYVRKITIPNSVTSIGSDAFSSCSCLSSITIPYSVTSIASSAFNNTPFYNNLPNGDVYLGSCYYEYKGTMPSNTSIVIKDGTNSIGGGAFEYCRNLIAVTIPDSVTSIGDYAFNSCDGLTSVIIPSSVTSIGSNAFSNCSSLTSITCLATTAPFGSYGLHGLPTNGKLYVPSGSDYSSLLTNLPSGWSIEYI